MSKAGTNNCLTCVYEPKWEEIGHGYALRKIGACNWQGELPILPSCYAPYYSYKISLFSDNSGIYQNCPTWKPKE